jgi:hypothetical protein
MALTALESDCGITPVRALFDNPMQISFISLGLWPTLDGTWQFVPHPAKQMRKLFWSARTLEKGQYPHYATALAIAFLPTYAQFQLMESFFFRHLFVKKPKHVYCQNDHYILAPALIKRDRRVHWKLGFVEKYRLPFTACDWQLPKGLTDCGEVWYHPAFSVMLTFECSDPIDRPGALGTKEN